MGRHCVHDRPTLRSRGECRTATSSLGFDLAIWLSIVEMMVAGGSQWNAASRFDAAFLCVTARHAAFFSGVG